MALDLLDLTDGDADLEESGDEQDGDMAEDEPCASFSGRAADRVAWPAMTTANTTAGRRLKRVADQSPAACCHPRPMGIHGGQGGPCHLNLPRFGGVFLFAPSVSFNAQPRSWSRSALGREPIGS